MAEIAIGEKRVCTVGDREVLLCNVGGSFLAVENRCSHAASKLDGGQLDGFEVSCPKHGARFDVRSGMPCAAPAHDPIRMFGLILDRGKINIVQPTTSASAINR